MLHHPGGYATEIALGEVINGGRDMYAQRIGELVERLYRAGTAGFAVGLHLTFTTPRYMFQTYPAAWRDHYAREGLLLIDPTVHWGLANTGWTRWSALPVPPQRDILSEATAHGMPYGITVATLARGSRSIASLSRADREYSDGEADGVRGLMDELHDLTFSIHTLPAPVDSLLRRLSILFSQS